MVSTSFCSIHGLGYPFAAFMVLFFLQYSWFGISFCSIHGSVLYLNYSWFRMFFWSIHDFFYLFVQHSLFTFLFEPLVVLDFLFATFMVLDLFFATFMVLNLYLLHSWFWISIYNIHGYGSLFTTVIVRISCCIVRGSDPCFAAFMVGIILK